jgi:ABC-type spermidine/putrescine transport system permease subunit I
VGKLARTFLLIPLLLAAVLILCPLLVMFTISFWQRSGFTMVPALSVESYQEFLGGVRTWVLVRTTVVALVSTAISLLLAYPVAYFLAFRARARTARILFLLLTVPFLINYVIRNFSLAQLLTRNGPINGALMASGIVGQPVDWLLYSNFSVYVGLVASYMPFMVFPLWLSLSGIDRRLIEASFTLGARPSSTFYKITLPLSMPGMFAAAIFGIVGAFGESTVPLILGGAGYELMGNTITSSLSVLNYPLAAAMSSVVVLIMAGLLVVWYLSTDLRSFLGHIMGRS